MANYSCEIIFSLETSDVPNFQKALINYGKRSI